MWSSIETEVSAAGFQIVGALAASVETFPSLPPATRSVVLVGWTGPAGWLAFAASPERQDGQADPLDRWTRRCINPMADRLGAIALYPFDGPPWHPFQRIALAAGAFHSSPIGLLIHPVFGLWTSYRALLVFDQAIDLPAAESSVHPCEGCKTKPCLTACPVGAYSATGFDVDRCRAHVRLGAPCLTAGCDARDACPVGREFRNSADQISFHQSAFAGLGKSSPVL